MMARNYKRDRNGRFARVNSLRGKKLTNPKTGQPSALKRAQSAAGKEQAFWDRELGPGAVRVTAGTTRTGFIRKKTIPSIRIAPTSKANAVKMQNWNAKKLKQSGA